MDKLNDVTYATAYLTCSFQYVFFGIWAGNVALSNFYVGLCVFCFLYNTAIH